MRKFFGVFELFSCFAEAFVGTFLTSSTDGMLRMHSLASSWKKSFSNMYFRGLGVRVFVSNAVSSAFLILDGLGTYLQLHFQLSSLLMLDYFSPEFLVFSSWIYAYFLPFCSLYVCLLHSQMLQDSTAF